MDKDWAQAEVWFSKGAALGCDRCQHSFAALQSPARIRLGRVVQVYPARDNHAWGQRLKLKHDQPLSNYVHNFSLRR